ncbi:MAG: hypothetical protein K2Y18_07260 [Alphaproteobacteria bacterium]|jgi:hypothetical protein|nr:hypothetical protein [Alphaproteobacteria bacterium]
MNQILLNVLSQDPLKTPGICLSFRWLLPLIPHLETIGALFALPILGMWLSHIFVDSHDLWDQVMSVWGFIYISTLLSMVPKPNTSSRLWIDANLFTVVYYLLYFGELWLLAHFDINLEYSIGWLFSIVFSTALTFLFYGILLKVGLSTLPYFKTIVTIYLLTDLGNLFALGFLSPYYSTALFLVLGMVLLIYLLLPYRHPLLFSWVKVSPCQVSKNLMVLRCLLWGALSVWADYIDMAPFYILEVILASDSRKKQDSVVFHLTAAWHTHKMKIWGYIKGMIDMRLTLVEIEKALRLIQKNTYQEARVPALSYTSILRTRSDLCTRNL